MTPSRLLLVSILCVGIGVSAGHGKEYGTPEIMKLLTDPGTAERAQASKPDQPAPEPSQKPGPGPEEKPAQPAAERPASNLPASTSPSEEKPAGNKAEKPQVIAEDDAADAVYVSGWKSDSGGAGFGSWTFRSVQPSGNESYAGFFIGQTSSNPDMAGAALKEKAFGMFANGPGFEIASAFRPFKRPLSEGQTFSFLMKHGPFEQKQSVDDPTPGSIGLTLRAGNAAGDVEDYNKGARFEFGFAVGKSSYQIYDGEADHDSGVPVSEGGLSVSLTLTSADTYDLEITTLADMKTTTLKGRKLGGDPGAKLESFCIFDRNGEKHDAFFNGFQVLGPRK